MTFSFPSALTEEEGPEEREKAIFEVPWGSESICAWCKRNGKCSLFTENPELRINVSGLNAKTRFSKILQAGSLRGCPINGFEPDSSKLPMGHKGKKIVERGY